MSRLTRVLCSKLCLAKGKECGHGKVDQVNSLMGKPNVNEEYKQAFRTKSYLEMFNKFQGQLETRASLDLQGQSSSSTPASSPSTPPPHHPHLSKYLLEPRQETLTSILESLNLHHFLVDYFEISLEASKTCEFILQNVHQVHINYRSIKNVIKFINQEPDTSCWTHSQYNVLYRNLASIALHRNPFSTLTTQDKFHELHNIHSKLLHQLTLQCRKTKMRTKFIKCIKRALATLLVVGCGSVAIVLLVLLMHSVLGMVAAPGLIICSLALFMIKKLIQDKRKMNKKRIDGLGAQLDIAARGVYIMINDFDTMSRLVQRLNDEIDHRKFVADICVRKGKNEMLKEVVKELQMHEPRFLEQLEELEKQIYLCFLDINRSRRLVVQEMVNC